MWIKFDSNLALIKVSFPFVIPVDAAADIYEVSVLASADGYENASASTTFDVIGSGDFFDNSTFDESFSDGSSSSDGSSFSDGSSSSSNDDLIWEDLWAKLEIMDHWQKSIPRKNRI